jgi:hypothetical protein
MAALFSTSMTALLSLRLKSFELAVGLDVNLSQITPKLFMGLNESSNKVTFPKEHPGRSPVAPYSGVSIYLTQQRR